jgi:hypothetical protein
MDEGLAAAHKAVDPFWKGDVDEAPVDGLPEIPLETYNKLDEWRRKIDQASDKRGTFAAACFDLATDGQFEHDLRKVRAIDDAVYILGRDHASLSDDDIQTEMAGAKAKLQQLANRAAANEEPPPVTGEDEYGSAKPGHNKAPAEIDIDKSYTALGDTKHTLRGN